MSLEEKRQAHHHRCGLMPADSPHIDALCRQGMVRATMLGAVLSNPTPQAPPYCYHELRVKYFSCLSSCSHSLGWIAGYQKVCASLPTFQDCSHLCSEAHKLLTSGHKYKGAQLQPSKEDSYQKQSKPFQRLTPYM